MKSDASSTVPAKHGCAALVAAFAIGCSTLCTAQPAWKPSKTVEFVVASAPGGGNDKTARTMQKLWHDSKWLENVAVVNKVGGGSLAATYTQQHAPDPHYLMVARLALITNYLLGRSTVNYTDLTPLAIVGNEPTAFAVRADSPIRTLKDLIARWRADPQSVSVSVGSSRGSTTHFVLALVAKAAGVDARKLKVITFGGGAESVTNLLGGHIDMMSASVDNALAHHQAGTMRILGIATAKHAVALPDVPTFMEQGCEVVRGGWTAIICPQGLTPAQIAYWESLLERTAQHPEWKRQMEADSLEWEFMKAQATHDYLKQEYDSARELLAELGMLKPQ
jgi:putative tricarboxylic transport membrane protein